MQAYCAHTSTKSTQEMVKALKWRWFATPTHAQPNMTDYALDNGAWACHQADKPFDKKAFDKAILKYGDKADFIVLPDIVMGGLKSLALSLQYLERMTQFSKLLIPVQNGMQAEDVAPYLSEKVGIFLGGDTEWKLSSGPVWGELAMQKKCHYHIGRVNTARRIHWCMDVNADSFDESSIPQFPSTIFELEAARQRPSMLRKKKP